MPTLNVSLPEQLRQWINVQVENGRYASASDYLRDLVREDIRHCDRGLQWLNTHLEPLLETPDDGFVSVDAKAIQSAARAELNKRQLSD